MPTTLEKHILLRDEDIPNIREIDVYSANDGYVAWKKAITSMKGDEVIQVVKDSGLRGRGGAGFSAGLKWSFIPKIFFQNTSRSIAMNRSLGRSKITN